MLFPLTRAAPLLCWGMVGVWSGGGGGNDWGSELLDGQFKVNEKFINISGIKCVYFKLLCSSSAAFWAWRSVVRLSGVVSVAPWKLWTVGLALVKHERVGTDNLYAIWDFRKWNLCLSFCRVCLIKQSKSLLDTAGFVREEYTNLAEIVLESDLCSTNNISVYKKQNIQSHFLLSSVVSIQSTLICLDSL